MPEVVWYSDNYGDRIRIIEGEQQMPNELALIDDYIIGVVVNGGIYPLWSTDRVQVIVHILSATNVEMTPELHAQYDRYFSRFIRHPRYNEFDRRFARNY